ncbi:MAG TPA: hypothetical protein VIM04_04580 [Candidatus Binatia bacterium]
MTVDGTADVISDAAARAILAGGAFRSPECAAHGIQDNVLGAAYHFLRQVVIGQLQRIVAKMFEDSVGHYFMV